MSLDAATRGWVAGVLDLQGRIVTKKSKDRNNDRPALCLTVRSKETAIVNRLMELTGTKPMPRHPDALEEWMRRPCAEHCPQMHSHVKSQAYFWQMPMVTEWTITGVGAAIVLHNVLPYVSTSGKLQDAYATAMANAVLSGQGSGQTRKTMLRMLALGWDLPKPFVKHLAGWSPKRKSKKKVQANAGEEAGAQAVRVLLDGDRLEG